MASLRRAFRQFRRADFPPESPGSALLRTGGLADGGAGSLSRREFVKGALALGAASLVPGCTGGKGRAPRVAIVGAGIAGLHAAHILAKGGIRAEIYEAGARAGGRMLTMRNIVGPGLHSEAGGEFVDSSHADMLSLAREMGLEIQDALGTEYSGLIATAWFFGGRPRSEAEVAAAVRDLAPALLADIAGLPGDISAGTGGRAAELDARSLEGYLAHRGVTGWLRDLIVAAYVSEFGLDAGEQSCLNLLTLVSLDVSGGRFEAYGESDERYRIGGGSERLTDALAGKYARDIRLNHRLEALSPDGEGFRLSFQGEGAAIEKNADAVILALPFTLLRSVDIRVPLPEPKRKAIAELGYGTNSKLFLGFSARPWRQGGYCGDFFTDGAIQCGWDHTKVQKGPAGGLTVFQGGSAGLALGGKGPMEQAKALSGALDAVFPGAMAAHNGKVGAFHWPTYPLSLGSYACYKPGQWTGLAGEEGKPVGDLFFAGEHCSADFQGYMNGGAVTGRLAAEAILAKHRAGSRSS